MQLPYPLSPVFSVGPGGQGRVLLPPSLLPACGRPLPAPTSPFPDSNCFHLARPAPMPLERRLGCRPQGCKASSCNQGYTWGRQGALWGLSTGNSQGCCSWCLVSPDSRQVGVPLLLATPLKVGEAPLRPVSQSSDELSFCP